MTAEVIRAFTHEYNLLETAEQEYELAAQEYASASATFDALNPKTRERFNSALERRNRAWDTWAELRWGSSAR